MGKERHFTISVPRDLVEKIKKMITNGQLIGYLNPTHFIVESTRVRLQEIERRQGSEERFTEVLKQIVDIVREEKNK